MLTFAAKNTVKVKHTKQVYLLDYYIFIGGKDIDSNTSVLGISISFQFKKIIACTKSTLHKKCVTYQI